MTDEITRVGSDRREFWNGLVEQSERTNPLYRFEALERQSAHTGTELHALVYLDTGTPVGLFPVFESNHGPITAVFSPPPRSGGVSLGPALVDGEQRPALVDGEQELTPVAGERGPERERLNRRFLDSCLGWVEGRLRPQYQQFLVAEYDDVRPFQWREYEVRPRFTYVVELTDEKDLLARFSRDARRNVQTNESAYDIEEGGPDAVRYVVERASDRHREQGIPFPLTAELAVSLYRRLPEGRVRPYVCSVDGERVGGLLVLEHGETVYRWQGGMKPDDGIGVPVNDLLDWRVIRDALDRGLARYDLVGAGNPTVSRYKAKFDPDLRPNYAIRTASIGVRSVVRAYSRAHLLYAKLRQS